MNKKNNISKYYIKRESLKREKSTNYKNKEIKVK